jgi:ComEC/Rec2-related protein
MSQTEHRPIDIFLLVAFIIGCAIGSFYILSFSFILFLLIIIGLTGLACLFPIKIISSILSGIAIMIIGFFWTSNQLKQVTPTEQIDYVGNIELLSLTSKPPQKRVVLQLKEGEWQGKKVRATVYDWTYDTGTKLHVSMTINPSQFASDRGSAVIGNSQDVIVQTEITPPNKLWQFRHFINSRIEQTLAEPYASLAIGLLTGAGDNFDPQFKDELRLSGTSHLVAVSGYNMTIVALLISRLTNRFGRKISFLLAIGVILFYYVLTGMSPAVARGAVFTLFLLLAKFLGRPTQAYRLLLLTAVVMLLLWPLGMVYSLSWQLSFLAFIGILFVEPLLCPLFTRFLGTIGPPLAETLGAQVPVLPLTLYTFGTLSLISPLTNIAVLSLTPYAMLIAALQAALSIIAIPLGLLFSWISYPLLWLIASIIEWSAHIPFASVTIDTISPLWCIVSYVLLLLIGFVSWQRIGKQHESSV